MSAGILRTQKTSGGCDWAFNGERDQCGDSGTFGWPHTRFAIELSQRLDGFAKREQGIGRDNQRIFITGRHGCGFAGNDQGLIGMILGQQHPRAEDAVDALLDRLIELALERHERRSKLVF